MSRWRSLRFTFCGTAFGLLFGWFSLTPSLLPRGPVFQGLLSGVAAAVGYALGVLAVRLTRFMAGKRSSPPAPPWPWRVLIVAGTVGTALVMAWDHHWQQQIRDRMGMAHLHWYDYLLTAAITLALLFVLVGAGKLLGRLVRFLERALSRVVPRRVSAVVVVFSLLVVTILFVKGLLAGLTMDLLNDKFAAANREQEAGNAPPTSPLRSGGPGSLMTWDSLGHQGRTFVSSGPSVEKLSRFNGAPAQPPIRVYGGLDSAKGIDATAELAARELERTGGLNRQVVAVATSTGTGWLNEAEASALEYMYNGDTAIVTMQYSFLPSWISFLLDRQRSKQAGQALFDAVAQRVKALPAARRPKLVTFGESLGSYGAEAPFVTVDNLVARTDGALFSGPTSANPVRRLVTSHRDPGSPQRLPIYENGRTVRFAAQPSDLDRPSAPWEPPRVVYLQHGSDPVAWWSPELLFERPDWLREPRGDDVSPHMHWFPIITFLQLTADLAVATEVPPGHGHRYVTEVASAWAAVLQPPGWTPAKTTRLASMLHAPE